MSNEPTVTQRDIRLARRSKAMSMIDAAYEAGKIEGARIMAEAMTERAIAGGEDVG